MAAQTQSVARPWRDGRVIEGVGVQASAVIYAGALLEIDTNGHVAPATKAASKVYFGIADEPAAGTATAGETKVRVRRNATVAFVKTGTAVPGKAAYAADDQTVTDVSTAASKVGQIVAADNDGVWVDMSALGV